MDSHEERVYVAVRQTQEREAKQKMREKAKELSKLQRTQQITGKSMGSGGLSGGPSMTSSIADIKADSNVSDRGFSNTSSVPARPRVCSLILFQ